MDMNSNFPNLNLKNYNIFFLISNYVNNKI